jgi:4-coumarate--CoA ligase
MTEFVSPGGPLPHIPDHLTLTQFILDSTHQCRPIRPQGVAWLVDDATGRKVSLEEVTILFFDLEPLSIIEHIFS